jgi:hypothetical protein
LCSEFHLPVVFVQDFVQDFVQLYCTCKSPSCLLCSEFHLPVVFVQDFVQLEHNRQEVTYRYSTGVQSLVQKQQVNETLNTIDRKVTYRYSTAVLLSIVFRFSFTCCFLQDFVQLYCTCKSPSCLLCSEFHLPVVFVQDFVQLYCRG